MHWTLGILRQFQAFSTPEQNPALEVFSTPAPAPVTQTVGPKLSICWESMMSDSTNLPVTFSFSYSYAEWIRILRDAEVRNFGYWLGKSIGLAFILVGIYELALGIWLLQLPGPFAKHDGIWSILYGLPPIIFGLLILLDPIERFRLRSAHKRREKIGPKVYQFKFGAQGASFEGQDTMGHESVSLSWSHFRSVGLGKVAMILRTSDGGFWAIPLRIFPTAQSIQSFKQFVELRIKESKVEEE